jgi:NAD(P)-dependent dehydrogenase (short-subunit alcohol dehydrogenase family)
MRPHRDHDLSRRCFLDLRDRAGLVQRFHEKVSDPPGNRANASIGRALQLVTVKLVGCTEVVHVLSARLSPDASILLFGGLALRRPYPGSTTISTVNGGVTGLVRTLAVELAPVRVNALHPGIVGDTPAWENKPEAVLENVRVRTPIGRLVTTDEIVDGAVFLLENGAVNGVNLEVDGGWLLL